MWFTYALFAGLLFAIDRLMLRSTISQGGNATGFMAVHNITAGILLLPLALIYFNPPSTIHNWVILLFAAVAFYLVDLSTFLSLRTVEASLFQIIAQLRHIVVLVGAYVLFAEPITGSKLIAIALITLGVGIAVLDKTGIKLTKDIRYAILSGLFIGIAFLLIKELVGDVSIAFMSSFGFIVSGALAYATLVIRKDVPPRILPEKPRKLILAAVIFALFEVVFFAALASGEASKVTPVQQSAVVFSLIGGYLFLNERSRLKQKIIGIGIIAAGISLLYF